MIFRKYYTIKSSKSPEELTKHIIGQHLKVHNMDFEIYQKQDSIKIIPHAENDDDIKTLPITRLRMIKNGSGTNIKMMCKPRRIDAGGPTLLLIFILVAFIGGVALYFYNVEGYMSAAYILMALSVVIFILFWYRLEVGYFDYARKIKAWVKSHV